MSLFANIEHLAAAQGISAVTVETASKPREFRGDVTWNAILDSAVGLFKKTEEPSIRLVIGQHTVVVQRESEEVVAVVLPTGHAIAKSLRRMIRRMSKKDRGPVQRSTPSSGLSAVQTAPPTPSSPPSPVAAASGWDQHR